MLVLIPILVENAERRPRLLLTAAARAGNYAATQFLEAMQRTPGATVLDTAAWAELAESDVLPSDDLVRLELLLTRSRRRGGSPDPRDAFVDARVSLMPTSRRYKNISTGQQQTDRSSPARA
jgi:hypothetical protein